jgi:hypothetical protein
MIFKYKGFAFYTEFIQRNAKSPVTFNSDTSKLSSIYVGYGILSQVSYLFKSNWEVAARFAQILPFESVYSNPTFAAVNEKKQQNIQLGVTKYLYGHRVKVQGNLLYQLTEDLKNSTDAGKYGVIFQIELGI